ncbi:S-Ena type endospore appendage [Virgibacillus dokdonensis]|uniref:S-Ena type endospore appendage n=1 Tax=Virgibacillus dokdonensis TaxID=302167 RepID=UPI00349F35AF
MNCDICYHPFIPPQSSVAITADTLTSITYTCTGPDPTAFCTGSFEASLYYCVDC